MLICNSLIRNGTHFYETVNTRPTNQKAGCSNHSGRTAKSQENPTFPTTDGVECVPSKGFGPFWAAGFGFFCKSQ